MPGNADFPPLPCIYGPDGSIIICTATATGSAPFPRWWMDIITSLLGASWITSSLTFSAPLGQPYVGLGPTVQAQFNPSSGEFCGGGGGALTVPEAPARIFNFGVLIHGNLQNAQNILSGWGWGAGGQATPFAGYNATWNSNGALGGPSMGVPGLGISRTFEGCTNLYGD